MNDRPMAFAIVGVAFAGFLYVFLNPAAIKSANERQIQMGRFRQETDLGF